MFDSVVVCSGGVVLYTLNYRLFYSNISVF